MHSGPVQIRFYPEQNRVSVLCPLGHVVTGARTDSRSSFAGSELEAKIGQHQAKRNWIVECEGAA